MGDDLSDFLSWPMRLGERVMAWVFRRTGCMSVMGAPSSFLGFLLTLGGEIRRSVCFVYPSLKYLQACSES